MKKSRMQRILGSVAYKGPSPLPNLPEVLQHLVLTSPRHMLSAQRKHYQTAEEHLIDKRSMKCQLVMHVTSEDHEL